MDKVIENRWVRSDGEAYSVAHILTGDVHPEGLDLRRVRFDAAGSYAVDPAVGHIVSVLAGAGTLGGGDEKLAVGAGVHLYLPPGEGAVLDMAAGSQLIVVSAATPEQARGPERLVRDEQFLRASAGEERSFRWILTPQYLSRRVFLHHDRTLASRTGNPVSWFHTTMFDVEGLPANDDGLPVFKMSYNHRTEFNVCYEVAGEARVRFASHPYVAEGQVWGAWNTLSGEVTYHLNEAAGGPEEEWIAQGSGARSPLRNRHEVYISGGHVSLCCLFDPSPTGVERHRPGQYSDYGPLADVLGSEDYRAHLARIAPYDEMVGALSLAKARGEAALEAARASRHWALYESGRAAQRAIEARLCRELEEDGKGRERVLARWIGAAE